MSGETEASNLEGGRKKERERERERERPCQRSKPWWLWDWRIDWGGGGFWWRLKDPSFHQSLSVDAAYRCNQRTKERHLTFSPHLSSPQPLERKRRGGGPRSILLGLFLSISPSFISRIWYADDWPAFQPVKLQATRKRYLALSDLHEGPHSNAVLRLPWRHSSQASWSSGFLAVPPKPVQIWLWRIIS